MNTDHRSPDDWKPCPAGSLSGLTASLKHQQRRMRVQCWGGGAAAMALLVAGGWFWMHSHAAPPTEDGNVAHLSCNEVLRRLPDYVSGKTDPALSSRIQQHLDHCPPCYDAWVHLSPAGRERRAAGHCPGCGQSSWSQAVVQAEAAVADVVSLML